MNEYSWLIRVLVQLPTFHLIFKGNHLLRWATAKIYFLSWFFKGFTVARILKKWVHTI